MDTKSIAFSTVRSADEVAATGVDSFAERDRTPPRLLSWRRCSEAWNRFGAHDMAAKCEMCESLSATHVEAVTQQLQQAMKLDSALRFGGDIRAASSALSQAQEHALNAWINFSGHFGEHAN